MKTTHYLIFGLIFLLIGFKYLFFNFNLFKVNSIFAIATYFLIGLGSYLLGVGLGRLKHNI